MGPSLETRYRNCKDTSEVFARKQAEEASKAFQKCITERRKCEQTISAISTQNLNTQISTCQTDLHKWKKASKWSTAGWSLTVGLVVGLAVGAASKQ